MTTATNPVGGAAGSGPLDAAYLALYGVSPALPAVPFRSVVASGNILTGRGMPIPTFGHVGNWYVNLANGALHIRLGSFGVFYVWSDPIVFVPSLVYPTLRYYGPGPPDPNVGSVGDYFLQVGVGQSDLSYKGPKTINGWPP